MGTNFQKFVQRESLKFSIDDIVVNISRSTFFVKNDEKKLYSQINYLSFVSNIGPSNVDFDLRRINEILEASKAWVKNKMIREMFFGKNQIESNKEIINDIKMDEINQNQNNNVLLHSKDIKL